MRQMKRLLSLLLSAAMLLGLVVLPVSADSAGITVSAAAEVPATAGNTVTVDISISGNTGLGAMNVYVFYKKDVLSCSASTDAAAGAAWSQFSQNHFNEIVNGTLISSYAANANDTENLAKYYSEKSTAGYGMASFGFTVTATSGSTSFDTNGVIGTVKFTVANDVESCTTPIEVVVVGPKDGNGNDATVTGVDGSVKITGVDPTIDSVTLADSSVTVDGSNGQIVQATATSAKGTNITTGVTWSVTPANQGVTITSGGVVSVDAKATAGTYTVQAAAKEGSSQGEAKTTPLTVNRATSALTSVNLDKTSVTVNGTTGGTINATAKDQFDDTYSSVTWSVTAPENVSNSGVSIESGTITIGPKAKAGPYTVTATPSGGGEGKTEQFTVTRTAPQAAAITISGNQNAIEIPADNAENDTSATFTASVKDQYDEVMENPSVSWTIKDGTSDVEGVSIGADGVVTVSNTAKTAITDTTGKTLTVTATCGSAKQTANITVKRAAQIATAVKIYRGDVELSGTDTVVMPVANGADKTYTYSAKLFDQYGAAMEGSTATWNTPTISDSEHVTFANGTLTVRAGATKGQKIMLTATMNNVSAPVEVTITDVEVTWTAVDSAMQSSIVYGTANSGAAKNLPSSGSATAGTTKLSGTFAVDDASTVQAAGARKVSVTFTVTTAGDYKGVTVSKEYDVTVTKKPVTVTAENKTKVYGEATPLLTYKVPSGALVGSDTDDDLSVTLTCAADATTPVGTVDITGSSDSDNYNVTVTAGKLTITAKAITEDMISAITGQTYDGTAHTPAITISYNGASLTQGTDFIVTYKNNTNAGTATASITGKGNYSDTVTKEFTIAAKALTDSMVAAIDPVSYDGKAKTPVPVVTDGAATLKKDTDYTVAYEDNVNAGTAAKVVITGKGNYSGTVTMNFTIEKVSVAGLVPTISGTAQVGSVLSANLKDVDSEELTWQWMRDGADITGATGRTYVLTSADSNKPITVKAVAKNQNYTGTTDSSEAVTVKKQEIGGTISITETNGTGTSGTIDKGDTLTVVVTGVTPSEAQANLTYQWYRGDDAIDGATSASYIVTEDDAGAVLKVVVSGGEDFSGDVNANVEVGKTVLTGTVSVTGASTPAAVGDTLTATVAGTGDASEDDYEIVWLRDGEPISGATGDTYKLTDADQGCSISVIVNAKGDTYTGTISAASITVPAAAPGTPSLTLSTGSKKITAKWTAPASNGAPILEYTLVITDGNIYTKTVKVDNTVTSYVFEDLTNNTKYTVTITAVNAVGSGADASKDATPKASTGGSSGGGTVTPIDPEPKKLPFTDVVSGAWYEDAVRYVYENDLMTGYGDNTFGPNNNLSRAELAQILYNYGGKLTVTSASHYSDVAIGAWYADAVIWASEKGVVKGYTDGRFGPNDHITREQLAVMLWRYAGEPETSGTLDAFTDADRASGYAETALRWAVEVGILNGKGNGILDPGGNATRAEAAAMLQRYFELIK